MVRGWSLAISIFIQAHKFYKEPLPAFGGGRCAPAAEPPAKVSCLI
jgi:hypothetical protein